MKSFYSVTSLLLACLLFVIEAQSQTPQQIILLEQLAQDREAVWEAERAIAESLALLHGYPITVSDSGGIVMELHRVVDGIPYYYHGLNLGAAKTISANKVWPGSAYGFALDGNSEDTIAMWDVGKVLNTHQEFSTSRVWQGDDAALSDHSTNVAGTIAASGFKDSAKGTAYNSFLKAFSMSKDESEMSREAAKGLKVSNHSYAGKKYGWTFDLFEGKDTIHRGYFWLGDVTVSTMEDYHFGFYSEKAQIFDSIAWLAPNYLIVQAAGNDRNEGPTQQPDTHWVYINEELVKSWTIRQEDGGEDGYDCIIPEATAKNILTVGAVKKDTNGYSQPSNVEMYKRSAWGPTDDGRIKPDLVAAGKDIYTTRCLADYPSRTYLYGTRDGTSLSAPCVTGSLGLLLQLQRQLNGSQKLFASTLKAILIHTADEAGDYTGPDYSFGWGLVNTLKAAQLMKNNYDRGGVNIYERTLTQSGEIEFSFLSSGSEPLCATICWTDPPGQVFTKRLNDRTSKLRNDLDVRIIGAGGTTYYPYRLDPDNPSLAASTGDNTRDNVEQVYIASPIAGTYIVRVNHKGTLSGGQQAVSIIITGQSFVNVTVDQKLEGGSTTVDTVSRWETDHFQNYQAPKPLQFVVGATEVLRGSQKVISNQKYNRWNLDPDVTNQHRFPITQTTGNLTSNFNQTKDSIVIRNEIIGAPPLNGGTLVFRDPWLVDTTDAQFFESPYGYRNLGMNAPFKSESSPFLPQLNSKYKGVFLNQGGNPITPPYYSVRVLLTQIINGFTAQFDRWEVTGATLVQVGSNPSGYDEKAVVFTSAGAVVKAMYKAVMSTIADSGWNMLSVPLSVSDYRTSTIWPKPPALSDAFAFEGRYVTEDTLKSGLGYWVKYVPSRTLSYTGVVLDSVAVPVNLDWNIIGSISSPLPKEKIKSIPDSNVISNYFKYDVSLGYLPVDTIKPGRGYFVKVKNNGSLILNANAQSATVPPPPAQEPPPSPGAPSKPRLLSPDSGAIDQPISLTFSWYQVEGATSYRFQLSVSSTFSSLVVHDSTLTTNSKSVSSLSYNKTYYWRVRAANGDGSSYWSNVWKITTTSPPPQIPNPPILLSPANNSTGQNTSLYLSWDPSFGATSYRLQVSRYSNFSTLVSDNPNLTGTSYYISSLSYSTKYYWRVNASNISGTSAWSAVWNFTTKSAPPPDPCITYTSYQQMDEIVVVDSFGNGQTLYMRNKGLALGHVMKNDEEMPPETPQGVFHARFHSEGKSGKFMASIPPDKEKTVLPIHIKDAAYPLTIQWNIKEDNVIDYWLEIHGGQEPEKVHMSGVGQKVIEKGEHGNKNIRIEALASSPPPCDPETKSAHNQSEEIIAASSPTPKEFVLHQNVPNPFNPMTLIRYELPEEVHVILKVYDILGQEITTLVDEIQTEGYKFITFDGSALPSGVYFYRIQADSYTESRKFLLMK